MLLMRVQRNELCDQEQQDDSPLEAIYKHSKLKNQTIKLQ